MPRFLTRIVALLLVPCLMVDPALAAAFSWRPVSPLTTPTGIYGPLFDRQTMSFTGSARYVGKKAFASAAALSLAAFLTSQAPLAQRQASPAAVSMNVRYENSLTVDHSNRVLRKIHDTLALIGPLYEKDPNTPRPSINDLRRFYQFAYSKVTLSDGHYPNPIFGYYRLTKTAGKDVVESWLGVNVPVLEPVLDRALQGDTMAQQTLFMYFSSAGKFIQEDDGRLLFQFVDEEVSRLQASNSPYAVSLETARQIMRDHGVSLLLTFTNVSGPAGLVYPMVQGDPQNVRQKLTSVNLGLDQEIYQDLRSRSMATGPDRTLYRNVLLSLLIKEGRGAEVIRARPGALIQLANRTQEFNKKTFNGVPFNAQNSVHLTGALQDPAYIERAKQVVAAQVYYEAVGYETAWAFLNAVGLSPERINELVRKDFNAPYTYLLGRYQLLARALNNVPSDQRSRFIRMQIFQEEVRRSLPDASQLITADAARRGMGVRFNEQGQIVSGAEALDFLMDPAFTGEIVVAAQPGVPTPAPVPAPIVRGTSPWLSSVLGLLSLAGGIVAIRRFITKRDRIRMIAWLIVLPAVWGALNHFFPVTAQPEVVEANMPWLLGLSLVTQKLFHSKVSASMEEHPSHLVVMDVSQQKMVPLRYVKGDQVPRDDALSLFQNVQLWTHSLSLTSALHTEGAKDALIDKTRFVISEKGVEGYMLLHDRTLHALETRPENLNAERYQGVGSRLLKAGVQELLRQNPGEPISVSSLAFGRIGHHLPKREASLARKIQLQDAVLPADEAHDFIVVQGKVISDSIHRYGFDANTPVLPITKLSLFMRAIGGLVDRHPGLSIIRFTIDDLMAILGQPEYRHGDLELTRTDAVSKLGAFAQDHRPVAGGRLEKPAYKGFRLYDWVKAGVLYVDLSKPADIPPPLPADAGSRQNPEAAIQRARQDLQQSVDAIRHELQGGDYAILRNAFRDIQVDLIRLKLKDSASAAAVQRVMSSNARTPGLNSAIEETLVELQRLIDTAAKPEKKNNAAQPGYPRHILMGEQRQQIGYGGSRLALRSEQEGRELTPDFPFETWTRFYHYPNAIEMKVYDNALDAPWNLVFELLLTEKNSTTVRLGHSNIPDLLREKLRSGAFSGPNWIREKVEKYLIDRDYQRIEGYSTLKDGNARFFEQLNWTPIKGDRQWWGHDLKKSSGIAVLAALLGTAALLALNHFFPGAAHLPAGQTGPDVAMAGGGLAGMILGKVLGPVRASRALNPGAMTKFKRWLQRQKVEETSSVRIGRGNGFAIAEDSNYVYVITNSHVLTTMEPRVMRGTSGPHVGGKIVLMTPLAVHTMDTALDIALLAVSKRDLSRQGMTLFPIPLLPPQKDIEINGTYTGIVSGRDPAVRNTGIITKHAHGLIDDIDPLIHSNREGAGEGDSGSPFVVKDLQGSAAAVAVLHGGDLSGVRSGVSLLPQDRRLLFKRMEGAVSWEAPNLHALFLTRHPELLRGALDAVAKAFFSPSQQLPPMTPEEVVAYLYRNDLSGDFRQVTIEGLKLRKLQAGQTSLHIGPGNLMLPVAEALMGLHVTAYDLDSDAIEFMTRELQGPLGDEIKRRSGSIEYILADVLGKRAPAGRFDHIAAIAFRPWTARLDLKPIYERLIQQIPRWKTPTGTILFGVLAFHTIWANDRLRGELKKAGFAFDNFQFISDKVIPSYEYLALFKIQGKKASWKSRVFFLPLLVPAAALGAQWTLNHFFPVTAQPRILQAGFAGILGLGLLSMVMQPSYLPPERNAPGGPGAEPARLRRLVDAYVAYSKRGGGSPLEKKRLQAVMIYLARELAPAQFEVVIDYWIEQVEVKAGIRDAKADYNQLRTLSVDTLQEKAEDLLDIAKKLIDARKRLDDPTEIDIDLLILEDMSQSVQNYVNLMYGFQEINETTAKYARRNSLLILRRIALGFAKHGPVEAFQVSIPDSMRGWTDGEAIVVGSGMTAGSVLLDVLMKRYPGLGRQVYTSRGEFPKGLKVTITYFGTPKTRDVTELIRNGNTVKLKFGDILGIEMAPISRGPADAPKKIGYPAGTEIDYLVEAWRPLQGIYSIADLAQAAHMDRWTLRNHDVYDLLEQVNERLQLETPGRMRIYATMQTPQAIGDLLKTWKGDIDVSRIAKALGVSRGVMYKHTPLIKRAKDLQEKQKAERTARKERKTNPTVDRYTHVGPALPIYQTPWPKDRKKDESDENYLARSTVFLDLINERRLFTDVSGSGLEHLSDVLKVLGMDNVSIEPSLNAQEAIRKYGRFQNFLAVRFDPKQNQLVVELTTDIIRTIKVSRAELILREQILESGRASSPQSESERVVDGLVAAIQAYAGLGHVSFSDMAVVLPAVLEIQIQEGLDYVECDPHITREHARIYLPASRVPRMDDRVSELRFKADMMSEYRHIIDPKASDESVEPYALWAFVSSEGFQAALDIHLPYVDFSEFARSVVSAIQFLQIKYPAVGVEFSREKQAELLLDYRHSIFGDLWDDLPNRTIGHPDDNGRITYSPRLTNPTGHDGNAHSTLFLKAA